MPQISLTDLVDVVSASGTPKATKVGAIKNRGPYTPGTDFYRPLRDGIIDIHTKGAQKAAVLGITKSLSNFKKIGNYSEALNGYAKWWGKKPIKWFQPARSTYSKSGIDVTVNSQLGLEIDGVPHLIKLYLKPDALSKSRVDLITVLMDSQLRDIAPHNTIMAVLDVRRGKLFPLSVNGKPVKAMIDAELAYIASLWEAL